MMFLNGVEFLSSPTIQGTVDPGTGLAMPSYSVGALTAYKVKFDSTVSGIYFGDGSDSWDVLLKYGSAATAYLRNGADSDYIDLFVNDLAFASVLRGLNTTTYINSRENTNAGAIIFQTRITDGAMSEVAKMSSDTDPWFGLGVAGAGIKVTNANLVGFFAATPVGQQTGADQLSTTYAEADIDTDAELVAVINVITTEVNALRTATNNLGLTTVV